MIPRMNRAGQNPPEFIRMNQSLVREGTCDVADIDRLIARKVRLGFPPLLGLLSKPIYHRQDITAPNIARLLALRSQIVNGVTEGEYFPRYVPCAASHPTLSDCSSVPLQRIISVSRWGLIIYGIIQFVPSVFFKRRALMRDPTNVLGRIIWSCMRSAAFLGIGVALCQGTSMYSPLLFRRDTYL
jgi:hypothetical protein